MKDLIEKILKYLPQYFSDYGSAVAGPKTFIAQKRIDGDSAFDDALIFLGISTALIIIIVTPLRPPGQDFWTLVGSTAVIVMLSVSLGGAVIRIAWWLVGGRAPAKTFFITYAYSFGVILVVLVFFLLLGDGVFKVFSPELYANVLEAKSKGQHPPDLSGNKIVLIALSVQVLGFFVAAFWSFIFWGAYRQINKLSKLRSFAAFVIAGLLSWPIGGIVYLIASVLR